MKSKEFSENVALNIESPEKEGHYKVNTIAYGSGKDKHRFEYAEGAEIITPTINCEKFIDGWDGKNGWWRSKFWGFNASKIPLNARVWFPESKERFPLVLIVHGDHSMQDFSDTGYAYLANLLASRGYIVASIDQNFFNIGWSYYFGNLKDENDARAITLLEHLKLWESWNLEDSNLFFNKVDLNNIALIGHSRGGEAVAIAGLLNTLPNYPDDLNIKFDYGFNIKSIVAIAPVDGVYKPYGKKVSLSNLNYLTLHGSYDGEVQNFMGLNQYNRLKFTDSLYHFKSSLYIHGANHGQFNTTWGNKDSYSPFAKLLNLKPLISDKDQQQIAKIFISGFLDATLKNKKKYINLFSNPNFQTEWLPNSIRLNEFEDSTTEYIFTPEKDFSHPTKSREDITIKTDYLLQWKENKGLHGNKEIVLSWDNSNMNTYPYLSLNFESQPKIIDSSSVLVFSTRSLTDSAFTDNKIINEISEEKDLSKYFIDFTIILKDNDGETVRCSLSDISFLHPPLKVALTKTDAFLSKYETKSISQSYRLSIKKFIKTNPNFNLQNLKSICFVFDKISKGKVVIDNIGFAKDLNFL
ncbi:alpha/beta hydrolase family protein [Hyunsoonleella ulvae]|uniref:alpha/beta hydrolase family protein n=1 Tax=Hyunsoonleella ulvae TaxID=2799948 RepID=UPI001939DC34|nr:hypothetical protein [Hyunsoonleella ulvae]